MARQMRDDAFRRGQHAHHMDPHIAPINNFVLSLRDPGEDRWVPEVAPLHAGVDAVVLSVLRDPGPKTQAGSGSGFLCIENDDPTAERQCQLFAAHGVSPRLVLPWNAYPWYINRAPNAAEREAGAGVLVDLISLLPDLRVVLLQGNDAADVWRRVVKRQPSLLAERGIDVVESIHPGRQALWTPDEAVRQARIEKQRVAFERVAAALAVRPC